MYLSAIDSAVLVSDTIVNGNDSDSSTSASNAVCPTCELTLSSIRPRNSITCAFLYFAYAEVLRFRLLIQETDTDEFIVLHIIWSQFSSFFSWAFPVLLLIQKWLTFIKKQEILNDTSPTSVDETFGKNIESAIYVDPTNNTSTVTPTAL